MAYIPSLLCAVRRVPRHLAGKHARRGHRDRARHRMPAAPAAPAAAALPPSPPPLPPSPGDSLLMLRGAVTAASWPAGLQGWTAGTDPCSPLWSRVTCSSGQPVGLDMPGEGLVVGRAAPPFSTVCPPGLCIQLQLSQGSWGRCNMPRGLSD